MRLAGNLAVDSMAVLLRQDMPFPDPRLAEPEGLVAVGGELSLERLLAAYRSGIFPWTVKPVTWWSPDPRGVFELGRLNISKSLGKIIRQRVFNITIDRAFREVIEGCAESAPRRRNTWISAEFISAYVRLHEAGHAHSLECWHEGVLAGGIYGVAIGGFFAGESMFYRKSNASKVALFHLAEHLRRRNFALFDIQSLTPITRQLGGILIPREEFLSRLSDAIVQRRNFG
jgi:leucyl/phenylalanyl-tRNA--protein transferase